MNTYDVERLTSTSTTSTDYDYANQHAGEVASHRDGGTRRLAMVIKVEVSTSS